MRFNPSVFRMFSTCPHITSEFKMTRMVYVYHVPGVFVGTEYRTHLLTRRPVEKPRGVSGFLPHPLTRACLSGSL